MSLRDSSIVLLEVGARRMLISREAAQCRAKDGLSFFDGNVKIHRSLKGDAIPNATGRCRYCDEGACKPLRVSRMKSKAASHRSSNPWKLMRVKGNRRGRKTNFIAPIEREFDPRQNARELRELSTELPLTGIFSEKFSDPDKLVRELELERNLALADGGPDAVAKLDAERREAFVETINRIATEPPLGMWGPNGVAEYIAKLRRLIFTSRDTEVEGLRRYVCDDARARALHTFLDEIEDHAAEITAARHTAAGDRDRRMNDPQERAKLETHIREIAALKEHYRKR